MTTAIQTPMQPTAFAVPRDHSAQMRLDNLDHLDLSEDDGLTTDEEMPEMGWHSDSESEFSHSSDHETSAHTSPRQSPQQTPQLTAATSPLVSALAMPSAMVLNLALTPVQILQRCGLPATPENLYKLQIQANKLLVDNHQWKKEHLPWMHKPCASFDEALDRLKVEPEKRNQWCLQSRYGHDQALQYTRYQQHMLQQHAQAQRELQQVVKQQQQNQSQQKQPSQQQQPPSSPPQHKVQSTLPVTLPSMARPLLAVPSMMGASAGLVCVR